MTAAITDQCRLTEQCLKLSLFRKQGELLLCSDSLYLFTELIFKNTIYQKAKEEKLRFFKPSVCEQMLREGNRVMCCLHRRLKCLGLFFFLVYC